MALERIRNWYSKHERPIGTISLLGGFLFNALTLTRVDQFLENFWVVMHLVVIAICILLINRENERKVTTNETEFTHSKLHFFMTTVLEFFFGGLISTFIVFYFRSAAIAVAWPFFVFLAIAFIANESYKKKYSELFFQTAYFFFCLYLFFIFFIPVLIHQNGQLIFVLSGIVSLGILAFFLSLLRMVAKLQFQKNKRLLIRTILIIFIVVNALYFLDLIPPLPLSLQDGGIYHSITRTGAGDYAVATEKSSVWSTLLKSIDIYPAYTTTIGAPAYAYSAIFSPVAFNTKVIHEWQRYDTVSRSWITEETIPLSVLGGRANGYRTYSMITGLLDGKWRVNVKTPNGQTIGRMSFAVVLQNSNPTLHTELK